MALPTKTQASASEAPTEHAPPSTSFPAYPVSWYFFGTVAELRTGPVSRDMFGQRLPNNSLIPFWRQRKNVMIWLN
jgi:hypothetical protein